MNIVKKFIINTINGIVSVKRIARPTERQVIFIESDVGKPLLYVDAANIAFDGQTNQPIGEFLKNDAGLWNFQFFDGNPAIETGNKELLKAMSKVLKVVLNPQKNC